MNSDGGDVGTLKSSDVHLADGWLSMQLLFGEHPFEKAADVEEGSVKRTLHRILKVSAGWHIASPMRLTAPLSLSHAGEVIMTAST